MQLLFHGLGQVPSHICFPHFIAYKTGLTAHCSEITALMYCVYSGAIDKLRYGEIHDCSFPTYSFFFFFPQQKLKDLHTQLLLKKKPFDFLVLKTSALVPFEALKPGISRHTPQTKFITTILLYILSTSLNFVTF